MTIQVRYQFKTHIQAIDPLNSPMGEHRGWRMRAARFFNATNWKYALGEVLLIVVGITIALAANSWYEDWQERRDERQVLQQLQQALEIDLDEFESRYALETRIFQNVSALLEHMQSAAATTPGSFLIFDLSGDGLV